SLFGSVRAVAGASGDGAVDWTAVAAAAKEAVSPGDLSVDSAERAAYAADVREARGAIEAVAGPFDLPATVEVQNRHHWIDANVPTFRAALAPLDRDVPGVARVANTGSMAASLAFVARHVLGQYDPPLLREGGSALYVVHPNVTRAAGELGVDRERFRRWIAFHEVSHAAEFGAAPWLDGYIEGQVREAVGALAEGSLDREALADLDTTMTAVEGYAELLMDRTFDREYADLRAALDARREGGGPLTRLLRRLFGLGLKRRQYERGKAFFESVADERGVETAGLVWEGPENLPTDVELDDPARWLARVA
ncbi:MAG: zinc-dependent metalloprotease, partial [Halobacteriaceae archaeon]